MRVLVAPDKFRGTATARAMADAVTAALVAAGHDAEALPLADGGEGFLDALGGANRTTVVRGPDGTPVEAPWRLHRRLAVIEMATASGLDVAGGAEGNQPVDATTFGTGELIAVAVESGATRVLVGVGGSATTDGGFGALQALHPPQRLKGVDLVVGCDVTTGFVDAAAVFGPQKGASPAQVKLLTRRLERLAQVYREESGVDVTALPGAGAAGGLAGGLATVGAELASGFDVVAEELDLDEHLEGVDLVVTGEGFLDDESFAGKVVGGVAEAAAERGVPVLAIVGEIVDPAPPLPENLTIVSLTERFGSERSHADPCGAAAEVAVAHCALAQGRMGREA
ncbi:MAG: glycerate kinase [Acidimicrobiales bacterium]|nr:glycerate kinase [Acidimicrobiales bacterium]